jgi:sugar lactone lactonase YvrE
MSDARRRALAALVAALTMVVPLTAAVAPAAAVDGTAPPQSRLLDLPSNDVAYDPLRDAFLVTVPGDDKGFGNELLALDPTNGAVRRRLEVGSEPSLIVVTDDASTAYVVLDGANLVVEVDLVAFAVRRSFPVGGREHGYRTVVDIAAVPGRSDTIVVSLDLDTAKGLWAYRNGAPLPEHDEGYPVGYRFEFVSPTVVFSYPQYGGFSGDSALHEVTANGVRRHSTPVITDIGGGYTDFESSGGLLYTNEGRRIDPVRRTVERIEGAFGVLEVLPDVHQVAYVDGSMLRVFSTVTKALLSARYLGAAVPSASDLVAGRVSFALASRYGTVLFGSGVRATGAGFVRPPEPASSVGDLEEVALLDHVIDLAYDPSRDQLYLARVGPQSATGWIDAVDPTTGELLRSSPLLSPGPVTSAISDDGSTLYVALRDHTVVRIDLHRLVVVDQFEVPPGSDGAVAVREMAVRPGSPDTLVISSESNGYGSARSYVHGIQQPGVFNGPGLAFAGPNRVYVGRQRLTMDAAGVLHDPTPDRVAIPLLGSTHVIAAGRAYSDEGTRWGAWVTGSGRRGRSCPHRTSTASTPSAGPGSRSSTSSACASWPAVPCRPTWGPSGGSRPASRPSARRRRPPAS